MVRLRLGAVRGVRRDVPHLSCTRSAERIGMSKDVVRQRKGRAAMERLEPRTLLSAYVVTTNADTGPGTLRQAMLDSNANAAGAPNEIDFAIGSGQQANALASPLPAGGGGGAI